jgi:FAD/FMN-containing dehydrogenase
MAERLHARRARSNIPVTMGADELPATLRAALVGAIGERNLLTDPDLKASYEIDWTRRFHGRAAAVVRPATTAEVAAILRACSAAGRAVVPQGGNTGLVGGGVPRDGEVVLSTTRLTGPCSVDAAAGEIVVPAGTTLHQVQEAARDAGFDFGVDIGPRESCTIGGMIAANAGGVHVLRYGMMSEQLIGVEAVLADGSVIGRVPGLRKDNAGYHLAALLAGSEGTLGVVTRAHLRLTPAMPERAVALLGLDDVEAAVAVMRQVRPALPSLAALELILAEALDLVCRYAGVAAPLRGAHPVVLLIECAGQTSPREELLAALESAGGLVRESVAADDAAGVRRLWRYRDAAGEAINAAGVPHKLDVAVPLAAVPEFVARVRAAVAAAAPEARVAIWGHVGDGNLHVNILGLAPGDAPIDHDVLRLAVELGGTIAAEHGVGTQKTADLPLARSAGDLAAMRAIKAALDPRGILNPGVVVMR